MAWIDPCLYLQSDAHPARTFRGAITEMWDEGLMSLTDLRVTQKAGGANFSVDISAGRCVVQGDSATLQGNYLCTNDGTTNDSTTAVTSAPSAGNERYDIVIVEVKDNAEDAGGINAPRYRVVAGTPAAVGTGTVPATPATSLRLAVIGPIVNSTTTITDSLITQDNTLAGRRCTPGTIEMLAGTHVPNGWLACDGSAVSRSTYARLFAELGTSYGVGNGSTTFNLPNLMGKVAVPKLTGQAQVDTIGETGGEYTHTLTSGELPAHTHTMAHTHAIDPPSTDVTGAASGTTFGSPYGQVDSSITNPAYGVTLGSSTNQMQVNISSFTSGAASSSTTSSVGSGTAHNVMQPYQVVGLAVIRT